MAKVLLKNKNGSLIYLDKVMYARKMDEDDLLELQIEHFTNDKNDTIYVKGLNSDEINDSVKNLFMQGYLDLSLKNLSISFVEDTIEYDQNDFDPDTMEEYDDEEDEETKEEDTEKEEYNYQNYELDNKKKFGLFGFKNKDKNIL